MPARQQEGDSATLLHFNLFLVLHFHPREAQPIIVSPPLP